jgi:hypothetical protein
VDGGVDDARFEKLRYDAGASRLHEKGAGHRCLRLIGRTGYRRSPGRSTSQGVAVDAKTLLEAIECRYQARHSV